MRHMGVRVTKSVYRKVICYIQNGIYYS